MVADPPHGRVLALDVGRARIGLAVTAPRGDQALPHGVLERRGTRADLARLVALADALQVARWVVGLPPPADPGALDSRGLVARFVEALRAAQPLPVDVVDEAESTVQAHDELRALGMRAARRKTVVDAHAAKIILDRWLALHGTDATP
ncbi:MAG: Holliday junction resolvase RuvX [Deltaproteobacteria bacterium]|nr:Holliday junction resolvase RuvX [Deltaproteobacteria bacterium]